MWLQCCQIFVFKISEPTAKRAKLIITQCQSIQVRCSQLINQITSRTTVKGWKTQPSLPGELKVNSFNRIPSQTSKFLWKEKLERANFKKVASDSTRPWNVRLIHLVLDSFRGDVHSHKWCPDFKSSKKSLNFILNFF